MVGPKSTQTRVIGIITDKIHPTSYFKQQRFYEKRVGLHLVCYYAYHSCLCTFGPTIPTYFYNYFDCGQVNF